MHGSLLRDRAADRGRCHPWFRNNPIAPPQRYSLTGYVCRRETMCRVSSCSALAWDADRRDSDRKAFHDACQDPPKGRKRRRLNSVALACPCSLISRLPRRVRELRAMRHGRPSLLSAN
ncbi:hypothetical protein L226DRAFT_534494 [Lentinus tigrinus ALCF2SS1-7]|uniref:uncharacterized protein n=1 Tax=Lentinus tigrinus ALCF2SS1-7 TaxID=1328758 RepID=UPI001165F72F|nr:hypothetical protein L226DRAFT_534494 [Lentinus tigrinus ALCF2SS1-7]